MSLSNIKGSIILLLVAILWGSGFVTQYIGGRIVGSFIFSTGRALIGIIFLFIVVIIRNYIQNKRIFFFDKNEDINYLIKTSIITGIILSIAILVQQVGVEMTLTAKSGFISSLTIIFVPIILFIFLKKKIKLITFIFIITSLIGAFLLNFHSASLLNIGDLLCLFSTICFSIDIIIVSSLTKKIDTLKFSLFRFVIFFIMSLIGIFVFKEKIDLVNIENATIAIIYSGIFVIGLAYTGQIIGERLCPPIIATLIMSLEGASAAILGYFILGQTLNIVQIIGCIIVIISNILVQLTYYNV